MKNILFTLALLLPFFVNSQNLAINGEVQFIEFNNSTSKFIVPDGKTWYIYNILGDIENKQTKERTRIKLTRVNDLIFKYGGPMVYKYGVSTDGTFPLIFKENTVFELEIFNSNQAFMTYIEIDTNK